MALARTCRKLAATSKKRPSRISAIRAARGKVSIKTILRKAREAWHRFKKDRPGWRFENFYQRWHERSKNPWRLIARIALGLLLISLGLVFGLVPGVPGIVFGLMGLALILFQFRTPALWCDVAEMASRDFFKKWRRRKAGN
jgi:hypothetical protein